MANEQWNPCWTEPSTPKPITLDQLKQPQIYHHEKQIKKTFKKYEKKTENTKNFVEEIVTAGAVIAGIAALI